MARLNKNLSGTQITDEIINRTSSTSLGLNHDTIMETGFEIWTGAGGTGTQLTLTTDYTLGSEDSALSSEAGDTIYTKVAIVNGAYHSTNLYVTYKSVGDYIDVVDGFPVGGMIPYGGASAPTGWLLCNGSAVSRTTYYALFQAIGTVWGAGNGSTTFNVPDMRESSPYGAGTYSAVAGTTHGAITAHDALALGAFGDDREQVVTGSLTFGKAGEAQYGALTAATGAFAGGTASTSTFEGGATSPASTYQVANFSSASSARTGATTRGKIIGVNYIIKY